MRLALLLFLPLLVFSIDLNWADPVRLSNRGDYSGRHSSLISYSPNGKEYFTLYTSLPTNSSIPGGLYGSVYVSQQASPTVTLVEYTTTPNMNNPREIDSAGAVSQLTTAFTRLDEIDTNGTICQTFYLRYLPWVSSTVTSLSHGVNYTYFVGGLYSGARAFGGGQNNQNNQNNQNKNQAYYNMSVTLVAIAANTTGQIRSGAILTTQGLEVILEIANFPYTNVNNSVRLSMAVATANLYEGNETRTHRQDRRFVVGQESSALYFDAAQVALVDGTQRDVQIAVNRSITTYDLVHDQLTNQLANHVKVGHYVGYELVYVTFPAGAQNITYDPTLGLGTGPEVINDSDLGEQSGISNSAVVGVVLGTVVGAALLVAVVVFFLHHRKNASEKEKQSLVSTDPQNGGKYQTLE